MMESTMLPSDLSGLWRSLGATDRDIAQLLAADLAPLGGGMPAYYTVNRSATTNSGANTCTPHVRIVTAANQQNCSIVQIMASVRNSTTAGSGRLGVGRQTTVTTAGGAAFTPVAMNPASAAAATTAFVDSSAFNSEVGTAYNFSVGFAQTGGQGGWVALERDNGVILAPNGGANGNVTLNSFTATASQALEVSAQFIEG